MLKTRNEFLDEIITINGQNLQFLPTDWQIFTKWVNKEPQSYIKVIGTLPTGQRLIINIENIPIYVDLLIRSPSDLQLIDQNQEAYGIKKTEIIKMLPGDRHYKKPKDYARVHFTNKSKRTKFIVDWAHGIWGNDMSSCDLNYMKLFLRANNVNSCMWNEVSNYTKKSSSEISVHDVESIKPIEVKNLDNSIVCAWDLETYTPNLRGGVPEPDNQNDRIKMCSMVFRFTHSKENLISYILTDTPVDEIKFDKNIIPIYCKDEIAIILKMAEVLKAMQPDFLFGFNDGGYDWPFVIKRIKTHDIEWDFRRLVCPIKIRKGRDKQTCGFHKTYNVKNIKIGADDNREYMYYHIFGIVCFDIMIELLKRNSKKIKYKTLNNFLGDFDLDPKYDMPYTRMSNVFYTYNKLKKFVKNYEYEHIVDFLESRRKSRGEDYRIFRKIKEDKYGKLALKDRKIDDVISLVKDSNNVAIYCVRDSAACIDLLQKANILLDMRTFNNDAFSCPRMGFYTANGGKVRQMICHEAAKPKWGINHDMPIAFCTYSVYKKEKVKPKDKKKYEGAFVFQPIKGLYKDTAFDRRKRRRKNTGVANKYVDCLCDEEIAEILGIEMDEFTYPCRVPFRCKTDMPEIYKEAQKVIKSDEPTWIKYIEELREMDPQIFDNQDFISRGISGLDFSSLYPSIIRQFNLSPDMRLPEKPSEEFNQFMRDNSYKHIRDPLYINVWFKKEDEAITPHNTHESWYVQNAAEKQKDGTYVYHNMGIFAQILDVLFKDRSRIKKKMFYYEHIVEELESDVIPHLENGNTDDLEVVLNLLENACKIKPEKTDHIMDTFEGIKKEWKGDVVLTHTAAEIEANYYNVKQLGKKVFMNTFYGEVGNQNGPFFTVTMSGGITAMGRQCIKEAQAFVEKRGYKVYYGDTDSIYISVPEKEFLALDIEYARDYVAGKNNIKNYFTEIIRITQKHMGIVSKLVNKYFDDKYNSPFLKMAYEEVLLPTLFCGKKKYCGVEHKESIDLSLCEEGVDFELFAKKLFVRGLEFTKRDTIKFCKENCQLLLYKAFSFTNNETMYDLAMQIIERVFEKEWTMDYYYKNYKFKESIIKKNETDTRTQFFNRMLKVEKDDKEHDLGIGLTAPLFGDRYPLICAYKPQKYKITGAKDGDIKRGEQLEYPEAFGNEAYEDYIGHKLKPDIHYYMNDLFRKISRYIVYYFEEENMRELTSEEAKKLDKKNVERVAKIIADKFSHKMPAKQDKEDISKTRKSCSEYRRKFLKVYTKENIVDARIYIDFVTGRRTNNIKKMFLKNPIKLNIDVENLIKQTGMSAYELRQINAKTMRQNKKAVNYLLSDFEQRFNEFSQKMRRHVISKKREVKAVVQLLKQNCELVDKKGVFNIDVNKLIEWDEETSYFIDCLTLFRNEYMAIMAISDYYKIFAEKVDKYINLQNNSSCSLLEIDFRKYIEEHDSKN